MNPDLEKIRDVRVAYSRTGYPPAVREIATDVALTTQEVCAARRILCAAGYLHVDWRRSRAVRVIIPLIETHAQIDR